VKETRSRVLTARFAALFVLTMVSAAGGGMFQGISGGPSMSYEGVSGSIDGIFASHPVAPSFPAPNFMTSEEFCQIVAAHLSNPPTAWDW
jgi:hypothetical protein